MCSHYHIWNRSGPIYDARTISHLKMVAECGKLLHGNGLTPGHEDRQHVGDASFQKGVKVAAL